MEFLTPEAENAPASTMPADRRRRLAPLAVVIAMTAVALSQAAEPVLGSQTVAPDSVTAAPVALNVQGPVLRIVAGVASGPDVAREHKQRPTNTRDTNQKRNSDSGSNTTTKVRPPTRVRKPDRPRPTRAATSNQSQGRRVVRLAARHLGAKFQLGATGPRRFDCSGLIYRVYQQAGLLSKVGGNHTAAGYYRWFKQRGLASRRNPRPGDLVVWTDHGRISHSGIYTGGGRVISALINPWGVKRTHVHTIHARFLAYLHIR